MPLAYTVDQPLQPIPVDQFNADGIAVVMVSGGRYGGQWVMDAYVDHDNPDAQPIGSIETTPDDRPSMAVDTAYVWMNDELTRAGMKIAGFKSLNAQYPPDQAPFFAAAQFLVVDKSWV